MKQMIKLTFDIEPVQQARPRATHFGRSIRLYDPPKVSTFKKQLAMMARFQYKGQPLTGPLKIDIWFYRPVQKSLSKVETQRRITGEHMPVVKPDLDNYVKSALDGLNGILWVDDRQITDTSSHKRYAKHPYIEIEVEERK